MAEDLDKLELYVILDVAEDAGEKDILKAYRKKALKCHPDKNPDNPKATEEFHLLSRALEVLTDEAARKAYDNVIKARRNAAERHQALDDKRKKFKEDLESKERKLNERETAMRKQSAASKASQNLAAEIDRLKKEGHSLLVQEQERLVAEILKETMTSRLSGGANGFSSPSAASSEAERSLKVKWKVASKTDESNGGYDKTVITKIFSKYGVVKTVVVSAKKKGSALVEFESRDAAKLAFDLETGLPQNPIRLQWVEGPAKAAANGGDVGSEFKRTGKNSRASEPESGERDFESLVVRKMRQAEERKRLIEQMEKEDNAS